MPRTAIAVLVDAVGVVLFVAIGRASHHHAETINGFFSTVWPFAVGAAAGWMAARRGPLWLPRAGVTVCGVTVAVGMVLRVIAGQGTAVSFILVALGFLGLVMVAGRVLVRWASGRGGMEAPASMSE